MDSVSVTRRVDAPPGAVREAMADLEAFMYAAGFDEVGVGDGSMRIAKAVGLARMELVLDVVDDPGAALAYEQSEGIFDRMTTRYTLEEVPDGTEVTGTTEFEIGGVLGPVLDATVVKRQRRREFEGQFDYLESVA